MTSAELKAYLVRFLSSFKELSEADIKQLSVSIRMKFCKKGEILVREGDFCNECYFVLKGCLRKYEIKDGNEITSAFYMEQEAAILFTPLKTKSPSSSFLVCAEDCILILGNLEEEKEAYTNFPHLAEITRKMMEVDMGKLQEKLTHFINSNAEERYLDLIKNKPELLKRVPQHQIASYIGISAESLSRIRRKIALKS
ncbi:MAG: Crp/Fnr family transcriptional regulator [Bacteroidia bacterium]